ncbi:MAG: TIR domain-containing protein [Methylovirgula sp.]
MPSYDAFISYSHAKDKKIAAALQAVVQTLGKPWYKRRILRLFRDDTSLSATPHLWPSIEAALGQSRFLILLASPEAAASPWVGKEIMHWLGHNSIDTLLIAVTGGELAFDAAAGDFLWSDATPLPPVLKGKFPSEPKWVDLRQYRESVAKRDRKFMELAADFAAAIRGVPKEDLLSEEVRQQRRALTLAWSAVGLLLVLGSAAGWEWKAAVEAERVAIQQKQRAEIARREAEEQSHAAELNAGAAQEERDRADDALYTSFAAANALVTDFALQVQEIPSIPPKLVHDILDSGLNILDHLSAGGKLSLDLQMNYAVSLSVAAQVFLKINDSAKALDTLLKSTSLLRNLIALRPDNRDLEIMLSGNLAGLGDMKMKGDDLLGARAAYDESVAIDRSLTKNNSDVVLQRSLGFGLLRIFALKLLTGDKGGAKSALEESVAIFCNLARDKNNTLAQQALPGVQALINSVSGAATLGASLNCLGTSLRR